VQTPRTAGAAAPADGQPASPRHTPSARAAASSGASTGTLASRATLPAATGCTIALDVQIDTSVAQVLTNTLPAGALATNGGANVAAASATFTVVAPVPTVGQLALSLLSLGLGALAVLGLKRARAQ